MNNNKLSLNIDLRIIVGVLLLIILGMLAAWRPWQSSDANDRKVSVTGTATLRAVPDQFQFSPYYENSNADRVAAAAEITKLSETITSELKKLGVTDNQIKANINSYGQDQPTAMMAPVPPVTEKTSTTLQFTITVSDKDLAQKVQDYLVTTTPKGSVTPYASFSTAKQQELENEARNKALDDARTKAEQTARRLNGKLGKVLEVKDSTGFGGIMPLMEGRAIASDQAKLQIQPGENEFTFTIEASFQLH